MTGKLSNSEIYTFSSSNREAQKCQISCAKMFSYLIYIPSSWRSKTLSGFVIRKSRKVGGGGGVGRHSQVDNQLTLNNVSLLINFNKGLSGWSVFWRSSTKNTKVLLALTINIVIITWICSGYRCPHSCSYLKLLNMFQWQFLFSIRERQTKHWRLTSIIM